MNRRDAIKNAVAAIAGVPLVPTMDGAPSIRLADLNPENRKTMIKEAQQAIWDECERVRIEKQKKNPHPPNDPADERMVVLLGFVKERFHHFAFVDHDDCDCCSCEAIAALLWSVETAHSLMEGELLHFDESQIQVTLTDTRPEAAEA